MTHKEKEIRNEAMRAYKAEGHTMQEVAERFNVSISIAQQKCKGIAPQKPIYTPPNKGVIQSDDKVAYFINSRCKGFEYAGNYTGGDGRADVRCIECGTIINRSMISIRHNNFGCPVCNEKKREQLEGEKKHKEYIEQFDRSKRKAKAEANTFNNATQLMFKLCRQCGKPFYTTKNNQSYCSRICLSRAHIKTSGSDDRLNRTNIVDRDIDLKKLFRKEWGVCYLCGDSCDWKDYTVNDNGVFIAGDTYPSIDHIVPLARGGKHSWDNVRLAHRLCNTKKGARINY